MYNIHTDTQTSLLMIIHTSAHKRGHLELNLEWREPQISNRMPSLYFFLYCLFTLRDLPLYWFSIESKGFLEWTDYRSGTTLSWFIMTYLFDLSTVLTISRENQVVRFILTRNSDTSFYVLIIGNPTCVCWNMKGIFLDYMFHLILPYIQRNTWLNLSKKQSWSGNHDGFCHRLRE